MKGFAFTLGLSTVLDLIVVFLFTHPLMAVLAGSRASGATASPASARSTTAAGRDAAGAARPRAGRQQQRPPQREQLMTRDRYRRARRRGRARPVGTDADETVDDGAVAHRRGRRQHGDQALADAGLPTEGRRRHRGGPAAHRPRRVAAHRLYNGEAGLDVVTAAAVLRVTAVVVLLCVLPMVFRGFNFGIEFAGGNSLRLPARTASSSPTSAQAAEDAGAQVSSAQVVGGNSALLRTEALSPDAEDAVVAAVAEAAGCGRRAGQPAGGERRLGRGRQRPGPDRAGRSSWSRWSPFLARPLRAEMAIAAIVALLHDLS